MAPHLVQQLSGPAARAFLAQWWPRLYENDPDATNYQAPRWLSAWASRLPSTSTPVVLAVPDRTGQPTAALALVRDAVTGLRPLSAPVAEYIRPVGPGSETMAAAASLADALLRLAQVEPVEVCDVPLTSALGRALSEQPDWQYLTSPCAAIGLPLDLAAMSASTRREHRRRQRDFDRWAATDGNTSCQRTQTTGELLAAYRVLAALHRRRWAGQPQLHSDVQHSPGEDPWPTVLEQLGSDEAFIATLTVRTDVVAAQLCLVRGSRAYSVLPAMDPDYRHLAVGHVLQFRLASDLHDSGFTVLDLGRTASATGQQKYKSQYTRAWTQTLTVTRTPDRRGVTHISGVLASPPEREPLPVAAVSGGL
ncbi:GNAT family N-acetyltransferase [Streptomyces sp. NBC_01361]|uniref:GNAT family N-acetyltransferase n=1 Tax=Streptomyces sp. NBC_01361 TaxID=2903838 RepID=UPI002E36874F|nr:GNAT family N-acetyltransferase [Streptomyces sp. NBC_01361]